MYALMFSHTDNSSDLILKYYRTKAEAMVNIRSAAKELAQRRSGTLVKDMKAGRVELRFAAGGGCAYYIKKSDTEACAQATGAII